MKKTILSYQGEFNQENLQNLVDIIDNKISNDYNLSKNKEIRGFIARDIFGVLIELAQNIQNYSSEKSNLSKKNINEGVIEVIDERDVYTITSGNKVFIHKAKTLIEYCKSLNKMDSQELELKYKEVRKTPRNKSKKGAGLGLIEIVRKTGNPIEIKNDPIDTEYSFITLSAHIKKENKYERSYHKTN